MRLPHRQLAAALALLLPLAAQAHTGEGSHANLLHGLMHPLTGWDHLCVLLSLGVLAAGRGARLATLCGVMLVMALQGGAALGLRFPGVPFVEPAILATVFACAALLFLRRHVQRASLLSLCLAFAFVHGVAHGQEAPAGDLAAYFAGFAAGAAVIYCAGLVMAEMLAARRRPRAAGKSDRP
jgi:urease accessory protein